ncbi:MAG: hypothetical protein J6T45_07925 [Fibrobacterales bacterium]|nr:hypothetical protein [Fibrobacterales bacterium]
MNPADANVCATLSAKRNFLSANNVDMKIGTILAGGGGCTSEQRILTRNTIENFTASGRSRASFVLSARDEAARVLRA